MKFAERTEASPLSQESQAAIQMPMGLLGFEQSKEFNLLADPEEAPFAWLQCSQGTRVSFLIVDPFIFFPDYQPDVSAEDAAFLGLSTPQDAAVFNIVTLRPGGNPTINLKGPIVINRQTRTAKQVIPSNAAVYQVQHPLPTAS
ncbi:MAG: flagellar assembly protein FliW [Verrucomicrobia bacterium]|nr:flagellar assembly protein FliW [Verrucomicrobiota bacterium]